MDSLDRRLFLRRMTSTIGGVTLFGCGGGGTGSEPAIASAVLVGPASIPKALPARAMSMETVTGAVNPLTAEDATAFATMNVPLLGRAHTKHVAQNGNWSVSSTWSGGTVPTAYDDVLIQDGATVVIDGTTAVAGRIIVQGTLTYAIAVNTQLKAMTVLVMGADATSGAVAGNYIQGEDSAPIGSAVTSRLLFSAVGIDTTEDPEQWGRGLLALGGNLKICGGRRPTPFVRFSREPAAGDSVLYLSAAVSDWATGDRLLLPDSRHLSQAERQPYIPQWETRAVQSVASDGLSVTLTAPLSYAHPGGRSVGQSNWVLKNGTGGAVDYYPHVANLTRNVILTPEDPVNFPAHGLSSGMVAVDICHALFFKMGRTTNQPLDSTTFDSNGKVTHVGTNQIGRYAWHFHHTIGPMGGMSGTPAFQFNIDHCAFDNGDGESGGWGDGGAWDRKWPLTIHDSHFGYAGYNVIYNATGAGLALEDGTEYQNLVEHNFICRVRGTGALENAGRDGIGLWSHSPMSRIKDNIATNVLGEPFCYAFSVTPVFVSFQRVPLTPGADKSKNGSFKIVDVNSTPLLEYANNEAYGATTNGFTFWHVGTYGDMPTGRVSGPSTMLNCIAWHFYSVGIFMYPSDQFVIDGLVCRLDPAVVGANSFDGATGIWFDDYPQGDGIIKNADIQGAGIGVRLPRFNLSVHTLRDSSLRNVLNIHSATPYSVNGAALLRPHTYNIINVAHEGIPLSASPHVDIAREFYKDGGANMVVLDRMAVTAHNQKAGDDFIVYYVEQAPSYVVPQTTGARKGATVGGLSNQVHQRAGDGEVIGGEISPSSNIRIGIAGYVG